MEVSGRLSVCSCEKASLHDTLGRNYFPQIFGSYTPRSCEPGEFASSAGTAKDIASRSAHERRRVPSRPWPVAASDAHRLDRRRLDAPKRCERRALGLDQLESSLDMGHTDLAGPVGPVLGDDRLSEP